MLRVTASREQALVRGFTEITYFILITSVSSKDSTFLRGNQGPEMFST